MSKRLISVLVALIMVIGLMPAVGATGADISSQFSDMPNNWATEALEFAVANHLLQGADGKIMPDKPLTRAEMATIIVRAFGASEEGDISSYTDVRKSDWFFEYIAKAFKMGVMEGYSGKMNPDSNITREQAFTVLARALKLQPATRISKTFSDIEEISDWARGSIYALVNAGYIQGSNGKLNPKADITRAEFAQVMFNLIKQYISEEGEYTEVAEGNVMINVPGATLKGLTVSGDLIIGDGVGDGDVVLDDVVVTGRLVIRGGGENSIIIRGNSNVSYIVAARVDGTVRILVEDDAEVEVIYVDDGSDDIIVEGNVGQIEIVADNVTVLATGASIGSANITGVNSRIIVDADSEVESISVRAANASIDVEGSVNEISTSGANTNVTGGGKVDKVNVEQGGNGASITTPNTEISVGENVTGVTAGGGEEVEGGQTVKNNKDGTGIVSEPPASGGTYVPPVIPVSAISIDQEDQLLEEGSILQLTTTISPANATNKKVTWASSDNTVVTVDNSGKVTAIGKGTATITVTTEDGNKTDTITITVPIVVQDVESLKKAIQEDADDGDTIVLRAGKYQLDETLVITKSVKILGPQANVDPRPSKNSPRTNDNNEAILTGDKGDDSSDPASQEEAKEAGWLASIFEIRANDVVINGLTLERTYNHIIYSQTADPTGGDNRTYDITGLQILNNIVRHGRGNEGIKIGRSINALVQYNYVYDILHPGDAIEAYDVKGFRILDNEIDGCSSVNGNIRVSNRAGGEPGIVRGNIIKNTEYHFAINAEDGSGDTVIDNNLIENAKAGGIFVYKNRSISEDTPMVIEITNNIINNYATNPVQGTDYKEKYLREAASAIAVSYNLREGIQPIVIITSNITSDGAENIPVLALGGGTTDTQAIPTDLSRITVNGNTFDKLFVKYIKVSNNNELDLLSDNTWPETQKVYNFTKGSVHDTIQTAIDEASEGDTIVVGPGTYKEEIHIEKQIKLIGTGIGKTILSAKDENSRHIIWLGKTGSSGYGMDLSGTVIKGFTINSPEKAEKDISSIYLTAKGTKGNEIIIEGNEFLGQDNQQSIAVLTPYSPNIKHVKVVGNQISTAKYGMYFNSMDNIEVIGNTIENTRYSGIIFYGKADYPCDNIIIKDNEFKNIASAEDGYDPIYYAGVGFYHHGDNITIEGNTFEMQHGRPDVYYWGENALEEGKVINATQKKEYDKIIDAITEADVNNIILVGDGNFTEDITIDKALTLKSSNGSEKTTLNGTITITADDVTVEGFTVVAPEEFTAAPVIHMIDADNVNILNNYVTANYEKTGQPAIGTSTGPARVTGKIAGNTVVGAIGVGTDGKLEVVDNTVMAAASEGIWFYPIEASAELTISGNDVAAEDNCSQIKVMTKPKSINGETDDLEMLTSITDENNDASVEFGWAITENVQAAIDAATNGDTILIASGVYDEIVRVTGKSVTLLGMDQEGTKIKAISAYPGEENYLIIKNLTVYGNNASGQSYAGIFISNGNVTIESCIIEPADGSDASKYGIETQYNNAADITVKNCKISGYKGCYFNPTTGILKLLNNDFNGVGPSVDTVNKTTITGNTNMAIGLFIGYGFLDKEPENVLNELDSEFLDFVIALHMDNPGAIVKLSTNSATTPSTWGGFFTAVVDGELIITEKY